MVEGRLPASGKGNEGLVKGNFTVVKGSKGVRSVNAAVQG